MLDSKRPVKSVSNPNLSIHDKQIYQAKVGSALRITVVTRPDSLKKVNMSSRYTHKPTQVGMIAMDRILQYLRVLLSSV